MTDPQLFLDAHMLLAQLASGETSSRDLLETQALRIANRNPAINAVVALNLDAARERAAQADAARARGESWGPLHGLPITLKDTYEVPGMPCTAGAPALRNHRPQQPALAARRLLDAGAIVFGKTNVPLFGADIQTYNAVYGTTNNPWDTRRSSGGSSGGAAAALAAGFTPLEMGSDLAGSIRIPSHYCGVYGHKSTYGIVPLRGHIPGPPGTLSVPDLAVAGPMARSARDLRLMLDVIAGPAPQQQPAWQLALPDARAGGLKDFRVLLWVDDPLCPIDDEMRTQYAELHHVLTAAGASVGSVGSVHAGAPLGLGLKDFVPLFLTGLGGVMSGGMAPAERAFLGWVAPLLHRVGRYVDFPTLFDHLLTGAGQRHADWCSTHEQAMRLTEQFRRIFDDYDIILMPPAATVAVPHVQRPHMVRRKITINGQRRYYTDLFMWIAPATLMGLPATSAPLGVTAGGLPMNVQIVGDRFQDKTTIRFAELLAEVMGGYRPPPGYQDTP